MSRCCRKWVSFREEAEANVVGSTKLVDKGVHVGRKVILNDNLDVFSREALDVVQEQVFAGIMP
jgi:hypothetical protein